MSRSKSYLRMLEAAAQAQHHLSVILEAQAVEAEKIAKWISLHLFDGVYPNHTEQLTRSIALHEKWIEIMEGLVKVENSLVRNLKVVTQREDEGSGGMPLDFAGLFGKPGDGA